MKRENPQFLAAAAYDFDDTLIKGSETRDGLKTHETLKTLNEKEIPQFVLTARMFG